MAKFTHLKSKVIVIPNRNIDTDQIIPARFLKVTDKNGLGEALFSDWRYNSDGSVKPDFVLNQQQNHDAGNNQSFGAESVAGVGLHEQSVQRILDSYRDAALS